MRRLSALTKHCRADNHLNATLAMTLRLTRQDVLEPDEHAPIDRPGDTHLWAIIDESALRRIVGSRAMLAKQMTHVASMAKRPNVTIQIIPFSAGMTAAYGRSFSILRTANGPAVLWLDHLRAAALTDDRSAELISQI